ncbi:TPA: hypothetical protein DEB02_02505, partial [Candidatus Beckwithbacteria bacterium]|nr:hypothetical protein [Candidatus Beckwithbacteria bacterium]
KQILENLGFFFSIDKNEQLSVKPASFRTKDIAIPEDIVEEVARIYGYHKLPSKLPLTQIPTNYPDENFHLEYRLKNILADSGLNEIYTNSMVSRALTSQSGFSINNHLKIKNALSADWQYLRRSLIPSHLEAIGQNPQAKSVSFFELANTYQLRPGKLPEEKLTLLLSTTNDFRYLKGVVDLTLQKLHLAPTFKPQNAVKTPWLDGHTAAIILKNQTLGCLGQVLTPEGFPHKQVNVALFDFRALSQASRAYPAYQPLSPHPPIIEDLTFTLPEKTYLGPVIAAIASCHRLVKAVALTKTYRQNYTFNVTYQSPTQPLTDKAVAPVRKKIVVSLKQKFSADLVGNLR